MIRRTLLVALLGCLAPGAAMAQETPGRTRVWGAAGLGAGVPTSGGDGIGNLAQLVYQREPHHAAIRALVLHDLDGNTDLIAEVGALYGRMRTFGWGHLAAAAGASVVGFDTCPDDDDSCFTLGVPVVAEAALSGELIGVGLQAFGTYNRAAAYAGAALFLQLGWLR